ncbi:MAG: leucine-rich repeat protein, partial [Paludibacteraceae bacterium]|nr:leucine-rich repeat protein [Paludibacteraceae bacterium]
MAMPAMSVSFTIGDFKYDVTDTTGLTVSVSAASDTISGKVTIPDKIEYEGKEYSVTAIGEGAFKKCAGLTSVIIPNTVASIGKDALHVDTVCCLTESDTIRIIRDTLFIHNLQEFISYKILAAKGLYMNAILEADIDLSSVCGVINGEQISWTPIRMSSGSFDGGNHTISNLYINQPNNKDNLALFD